MLVESGDVEDLWRFAALERSFVFVGLPNCEACATMRQALLLVFRDRAEEHVLLFEIGGPDVRFGEFLREYLSGRFPEFLYFVSGERKRRWVGFFKEDDFETKVRRLTEVIDSCS